MSESQVESGGAAGPRIGEYQIVETIGRGATGTVYLARHQVTEDQVALKMLHCGAADETVERFTREVAIAQQLVHRHVVTVLDTGLDDGLPYLVMELLRGQTLRDVVRANPQGVGVERAVELVAQLCLGLHHAHEQGLVHRDVKPANVFVTNESVVKVLDFGVAKLSDSTVTSEGALVGTLAYMAPEQLHGRYELDGRADIFSAGVILHELLTGKRPFDSESSTIMLGRILNDPAPPLPTSIGASPDLQAVLVRALEKEPEQRFATAQELAHALWRLQLERQVRRPVAEPARQEPAALPLRGAAADAGEVALDVTLREPQPAMSPSTGRPSAEGRATDWRIWAAGAAAAVVLIAAAGFLLRSSGAAATPPVEASAPTAPTPGPSAPPSAPPAAAAAAPAKAAPAAEPAAAPTATAAEVQVDSTPPGAQVALNGTVLGRTPVSARLEIDQKLRLTRSGFEPATVAVDADAIAAGKVTVAMKPVARVKLHASGPYPFEIVVGNDVISAASPSHDVAVAPGQTIALRSRELLLDQRVKIDAPAGGSQAVEVQAPGRLSVRTLPGPDEQCRVLIDQRDFSNPPLSNIPVAAGPHELALSCAGGVTKRNRVEVGAGAQVAHTVR